jgi:hypothetical protein
MTTEERRNVFRRYFASSRYNRLYIQKNLIGTAFDESSRDLVSELQIQHDNEFYGVMVNMKKYGYIEEFISAAEEEVIALQKILEAYDKRMKRIV